MDKVRHPGTLLQAVRYFSDLEVCRAFMVALRWPNGVTCPRCGSDKVTYLATARVWKCRTRHEKQKFSAKVGTIMEDSPIGLDAWLPAMWLIANCKNGISSYELARALDVTQKTAWFMLHRIRLAMQQGTGMLGGPGSTVEVDETFIGGKARNMNNERWARTVGKPGRSHGKGKTVVMGLLDRHGKDKGHSVVRARVVKNRRKVTLQPEVKGTVAPGTTLMTDECTSYSGLGAEYEHKVINHAETYVEGNVHTNGMENFWSLLKRGIGGTYVSVEPFHLFRYVDEQAFRFNTRKASDGGRFLDVVRAIVGKRLTYQHLIGGDSLLATA